MVQPRNPPRWPIGVAVVVLAVIAVAFMFFASRVEMPDTSPVPDTIPAQIRL